MGAWVMSVAVQATRSLIGFSCGWTTLGKNEETKKKQKSDLKLLPIFIAPPCPSQKRLSNSICRKIQTRRVRYKLLQGDPYSAPELAGTAKSHHAETDVGRIRMPKR